MRLLTVIFLFAAISLASCSKIASPTDPQDNLSSIPQGYSSTGLLGAYELVINKDMTTQLNPKRLSSVGEDFLVSGIAFFTMVPCADCLQMKGLSWVPGGNLNMLFHIRHPFAKGSTGNPPSAKNRLDLDVFDLAMVIEPVGAESTSFFLNFEKIYTDVCADADGYTFELFDMLENDVAMPYFLVVDESEMDPIPDPSTYNKFEMGASADFTASFIYEPGKSYTFNMYLTMGYGASAVKSTRLTPKYFNPEFNRKSAWKVVVTPPQGDDPPALGNTWDDVDGSTFYTVKVEVYDWQIGAEIYADPDNFADAPINNVYEQSEVERVRVEVLGMMNDWASANVADSGTGMPGDPLVFNISVANNNFLPAGEYPGLVTVIDNRIPGDPFIDTRGFLIDTPNGIILNNWTIGAYQTYQLFTATVVDAP
jgi:hypothetical protein